MTRPVIQAHSSGFLIGVTSNAPRINGDVRRFWNANENLSIARSIKATSSPSLDVRSKP